METKSGKEDSLNSKEETSHNHMDHFLTLVNIFRNKVTKSIKILSCFCNTSKITPL